MSKRRKRVDQDEEQSQNRLASSSQADAAALWRLWGSLFILRHNVPQRQRFLRIRLFQQGIPDQREWRWPFLLVNTRHAGHYGVSPCIRVQPLGDGGPVKMNFTNNFNR